MLKPDDTNSTMAATNQDKLDAELHYELTDFLNRESYLLDNREYREWYDDYLHEDIEYQVPKTIEREAGSDRSKYSQDTFFFDENYSTFRARIERLEKEYAWGDNPPSRVRHFISNVIVDEREDGEDAYEVISNVLIYRNSGGSHEHDLVSGERHDVIIQTDHGYRLQDREVLLDSPVIGTKNLPFFF